MDEGKDAMNTKQKNSVNTMKSKTQIGQADGKLPTQLKSAMSTYEPVFPPLYRITDKWAAFHELAAELTRRQEARR